MKISFLILTHNRPKLFKRCIESILKQEFDFDIEILVNNDSNDISEDYMSSDIVSIKYLYKQDQNLSNLYKYLFDLAIGEYIYFLEDDDYLSPNFAKHISNNFKYNSDMYYMNYKRANATVSELLNNSDFKQEKMNLNFQLSQILFKKFLITDQTFPKDNKLDNDWLMYQEIEKQTDSITLISNLMFIQTTDGNDNISFPHLNKDIRWNL